MANSKEPQFFNVVVKLEQEQEIEDKKGNVKIKTVKWSERWLVKAATSEEANKKAMSYYDGEMLAKWYIHGVTATNYLGVIEE